jgi:3-hydroxyacyl-CoA dehydrogenase / enoyl-CoA hydratase / 3-hydroxybutyryl-CoA epimerase
VSTVRLTVDAEGIALLAIDIPDRPMNVLTPDLRADLRACIEQVATDPAIKGAILTSAKPGSFMAGADLKHYVTAYERGVTAVQARDLSHDFQQLIRRIETCGKPIAAAINGLALGGGLELVLGCHYRVLASDAGARVGLPEVSVGLMPGGGGTQRLPRLIGVREALSLVLSGTHVEPSEALRLGIVNALAPADRCVDTARTWLLKEPDCVQPWDKRGFTVPGGAGPLAASASESFMVGAALMRKRTQGNLPAPLAIMSCVYEGTIVGFERGLAIEAKYFGQVLSGPVPRNLMRTLFVNRRIADKLGRRPKNVPRSTPRKLGVLGAGMMGSGLAHVAAGAGMDVVLIDATQASADAGKAYSTKLLTRSLQQGVSTQDQVEAHLARIDATADYSRLEGCDLVLEAVFENREVKGRATRRAEEVIPPTAIFASNTSTLPITSLACESRRPAQFIGLHFFSPVDRMPLVEVIRGRQTSDETVAKALDFVALLKKTPIIVNDSPAFYTTRVFSTFVDEGVCMLAEGIEPALIENAARMAGMPVGPLAQLDEVSQELSWKVIQQARADGLDERHARAAAAPAIQKMISLQRRGRRYGGGFYEYPSGGARKFLWPALREHFPSRAQQPPAQELTLRFLTIQALETARCAEEGIIDDPADADLGSLLGFSYPQWTGGTLSYIETIGLTKFVDDCTRFADVCGPRYQPSAWLRARATRGELFHPRAQLDSAT